MPLSSRRSRWSQRVPIDGRRVVVWLLPAVLVGASIVGACSSSFDRERAIADAIDQSGGRITADQAGCYVDRVRKEVGSAVLRPGAEVPPEKASRMVTIRVDCIGVANLGTSTTTRAPGATDTSAPDNLPRKKGDSPTLDALYDQCAAGFGQSCDDLFAQAPIGSPYEQFASTCGGRTSEVTCVAVYPSPGVVLPSDAQATTTEPPASP